jgi:PTS system nitrogen regulatory IIA component
MFDTRADLRENCATAPHADAGGSQENSVAGLLALEDILLDDDATTRGHVFVRVATLIGARYGLREDDVVAGLVEREELGSTALGQGVALPHARLKGLTRPIAAFIRPRLAIPFDAPDGKPVSSVLVLLVPEGATDAHLELLAQAASMFCDKAFRDRLRTCAAAPDILATFADWRST